MTIDDDKSIYVGGLPYDCSESELRRAFELYGSVVAVKIINDRGIGGKCYGFVTFTNARSAVDAINDMNGQTIGGRVVRVNEVKTRSAGGAGGRSNYPRESFRRYERDVDWDTGRVRDRDSDHDKDRQRDRSWELGREREREPEPARDHIPTRDHFRNRDRDQGLDLEERQRGHSRHRDQESERDDDVEPDQDRQVNAVDGQDRRRDKDRDQHAKKRSRSSSYERHSREFSSESSDYQLAEEQLELLIQTREELKKEKSELEDKLEDKGRLIADLRKRSQKLEDALTSAKKLSALRQMQLSKLHGSFLQVKGFGERLKTSEQELQGLVESARMEMDAATDVGMRDACLLNGIV